MKSAYLLIDARGPEIRHRSGLTAPDPFIYLAPDNADPVVWFDAREFEVMKARLKKLNKGVQIEHLEPYLEKITAGENDPLIAVTALVARERGIEEVRVSGLLPYALGQQLEAAGLEVVIHDYAREREQKTEVEIEYMIAAQRVNESAFDLAWQILADSTVRGNKIMYNDKILTSEILKSELRKHLLDRDYSCPEGLVVASGEQSAEPHNEGNGPLLPNESIIIDIFPRSEKTGFFADMTRTFVKGEPSPKIKDLFSAVEKVQKQVIDDIAVGQECLAVHQKTIRAFKELGYEASHEKGFMHGTGHSLGLNIHEGPRLNAQATRKMGPGMVVTIEPGLYYPGLGGVRIEDVVVFHPDGKKENITKFNKPCFIS